MKWIDFERAIKQKHIKLFTPLDVQRFLGRSKVATTFLMHRLKKQGYIQSVKRGLYKLPGDQIPDVYLANKIYEPSYVSLEFALSYYQIIPETVYGMTSVTPKITRRFKTLGKIFSYRRIKKAAYAGYTADKQKNFSFFIADPEKAFVDANYFRMIDGLEALSRFDKDKINAAKALRYARLFGSEKFVGIIKKTLQ